MGIKTQKVLRFISKTVLFTIAFVLIGYVGLVVYKSVINRPQKVRVTNVTDSAVTITWVTDNPVRGVVYYNVKDSVLPGPFGFLFSNVGYDDRDFAVAQKDCVNAFNENAKNTKDANFAVSGSNFDCEDIKVEKLGAYYTHSITLKNLNESSTYFFKVGNGIWSWNISGVGKDIGENDLPLATKFNFVTGKVPTTIPTPNIAYGNVYAAEMVDGEAIIESPSKDALVFAYLTIDGIDSQTISTVANTDGGWILDKSNFRDLQGELITDLSKAKLNIGAQYEDINVPRWLEISELLNEDTNIDLPGNLVDDLTPYERSKALELFDKLIEKVYAVDYNPDCHTNCGGPQAPNCSAGSDCVKNCFNKCVGADEWVSTGGILLNLGEEATGNNCEMPASCGCTPDTCEENCDDKTQRTCKNHYWSSWVAGSCTPTQCGGDGGDGECDDVSDVGCIPGTHDYCSQEGEDYFVVVNDAESCGGGGGDEGDCTKAEYDHGCYPGTIGDHKSKKCLKDGNVYNWKEYSDDSCGSGDVCTTPTTCTKNATTQNWELCTSGVLKNYGKNDSDCNGKDDPSTVCNVKGDYVLITGVCKLDNCDLICDGTVVKHYSQRFSCHADYPNVTLEYPDDGNNCGNPLPPNIVNIEEIDIDKVGEDELKSLVAKYPSFRGTLENMVAGDLEDLDNRDCKGKKSIASAMTNKLCRVLTGNNTKEIPGEKCETGIFQDSFYFTCGNIYSQKLNLVSKAYAQDNESDGSTLYLPEYGMYSFQLGDYELKIEGGKYYIFYIEANGQDGFQPPEDPDNPTAEEDIVLKSNSAAITYEKLSSAQKYTIVKGINIISFDFVPVATDLGAYSASDVITQAKKDGVTIQYISTFGGGRWDNGYSCTSTPCTGNDFTIVPGKGYLVYATTGGDITIPGYTLTSGVPIAFSAGWNLIGVHGYTTAYTARSFIDSINTIEGLTANNVSWWPTSKAKYEGLQVDGIMEYGLDFPISPTNGYFVRISDFAPSNTTCKSLIWQIGGTLNGVCGNTK